MRLVTTNFPVEDPFGIFPSVKRIQNISELTKDDCLILWGGADIGTELYNEKPGKYCYTKEASFRDKEELEMLHAATYLDIPIIGICRGAQLMTVFTGGYLVQHVDGHGKNHPIYCHDTEKTIQVNSAHHQVCQPIEPSVLLATSEGVMGFGEGDVGEMLDEVPEVIYFPQIRGIGIQYHPEWESCPREAVQYAKECILDYIINEPRLQEAA